MTGIYPRPIVLAVYQRTEADTVVVSVSIYDGDEWLVVLPETDDLLAVVPVIECATTEIQNARVSMVTSDTDRRVAPYGRRVDDRLLTACAD